MSSETPKWGIKGTPGYGLHEALMKEVVAASYATSVKEAAKAYGLSTMTVARYRRYMRENENA